ncbi:putative Mitochondrial carrier protein [Taphrina deformans PYCC 5710]|uniref:Mitochondrial carrier protein n=1 Tax=Taphrina deformans (strain PYCC 5710 / ATCC 11124 / CBS 356.35 / IMI 108563 / JCM 9778 / NBRC 8474) TaxID=1097556 RepID=R4X6K3_TAPDE|nr:putative Mitochondrial carrier protein [Taphrina deformans PYCC 5710]|eukprot:CCG80760.1 putative Mitochondrial carrier protein [Taphrina deformans PYCC 5710]
MSSHGEDVPPIVHALSGAVASIFSNSFVYPLDLVTTRIQTQEKSHKRSRRDSGTPLTHDKYYESLPHALFTIYEEEGILALWQGVWADNVSTMASTFCYHYAYNYIREKRFQVASRRNGGKKPSVLGMVEELTIGASAGVIARFVTAPTSNIVTRSQTQGGSTAQIIRAIYKEKGITGFWSGMKASVILAANPSISYYLFEMQKALLVPKSRRDDPKSIEIFLMSATGKAIATLLLYPIILVKAKTQALRAKSSLWTLLKGILEKDGLGGLYDGALPQVLKGFLSQGILMALKDRIAALIISGYLAISRRKRRVQNSSYYYSDSPKTDVNGLIAATKDKVEIAVDNAVDKVKEVAGNVADSMHLEGAVEQAKNYAQTARDASGIDGAVDKARELTQSARESSGIDGAYEKAKEMAQSAVDSSSTNMKSVTDAGREKLSDGLGAAQKFVQQTDDKPVRAISNAVQQGKADSPEWSNQTRSKAPEKIDGIEWQGQTRKPEK